MTFMKVTKKFITVARCKCRSLSLDIDRCRI